MLDKNGLTEEEFLRNYDASKYDRPSVTVDIIVIRDGKLLLIRRGGHPFIGKLALPGGFCEPKEDLYAAASRELFEETGLRAEGLKQICCFSSPDRDPRTRIITVPFVCEASGDALAADDAADAQWFSVSKKTSAFGGQTISELGFAGKDMRFSVKVAEKKDASGVIGDTLYTVIGESPIAGDHAAVICCALDR